MISKTETEFQISEGRNISHFTYKMCLFKVE